MADASGGGHGGKRRNSGRKRRISDLRSTKGSSLKTVNVFSSKIIYFSRGLVRSWRQDMGVVVTAISRHICYLLNIGEGKFWFSLPDELTVKKVFVNESFMFVPCVYL